MNSSDDDEVGWGQVFVQLSEHYGWTFEEIADMSLDQIFLARNEGKVPKASVRVRSDRDAEFVRQNWRRFLV